MGRVNEAQILSAPSFTGFPESLEPIEKAKGGASGPSLQLLGKPDRICAGSDIQGGNVRPRAIPQQVRSLH